MQEFRVLELFSGIGGMHFALKYAKLAGEVVAAVDINTVANTVYQYNHPNTVLLCKNIQSLTPQALEKLDVNMLLMSPPCQPHTRQGHQRDIVDKRSDALQHLCKILPQCTSIHYVLMENVKGFESSQAHQNFLEALRKANFYFREFILSPTEFGIPNTRHRYYCVARKKDFAFSGDSILLQMPAMWRTTDNMEKVAIRQLLEPEAQIPAEAYLPENVLTKRIWLLDVVAADARSSMCFTKAYTHYSEGTGSVFTSLNSIEAATIFAQLKELEGKNIVDVDSNDDSQKRRVELLNRLQLRYFTPVEVARLMSFPETFGFPTETTTRQKYRLLGNSINIRVVGELIKLLCA